MILSSLFCIAGQRAPPVADTYISLSLSGPLDCLLHCGLAGTHSRVSPELAAVLAVPETPGTLQ